MKVKRLSILVAALVLWAMPIHAQQLVLPWQTSTAYEANHVFAGSRIYNLTVNFHTASYRTLMIFDAATVPADGASEKPYFCMEGISQSTDPAESFKSISFVGNGLLFTTGIAVTVSTSTAGCSTLTSDGSNDWFQVQSN